MITISDKTRELLLKHVNSKPKETRQVLVAQTFDLRVTEHDLQCASKLSSKEEEENTVDGALERQEGKETLNLLLVSPILPEHVAKMSKFRKWNLQGFSEKIASDFFNLPELKTVSLQHLTLSSINNVKIPFVAQIVEMKNCQNVEFV